MALVFMRVSFWYKLVHHSTFVSLTSSHVLLKSDYFLIEDIHGTQHKYYLRNVSNFEVKI